MMGRLKSDQGQLFYEFHLGEAVPEDHLVRKYAENIGVERRGIAFRGLLRDGVHLPLTAGPEGALSSALAPAPWDRAQTVRRLSLSEDARVPRSLLAGLGRSGWPLA
jgi:hypothetical protein